MDKNPELIEFTLKSYVFNAVDDGGKVVKSRTIPLVFGDKENIEWAAQQFKDVHSLEIEVILDDELIFTTKGASHE